MKSLDLQSGDVLLVQTSAPCSTETEERIEEMIQKYLIEHLHICDAKVLVGHGLDVTVFRRAPYKGGTT